MDIKQLELKQLIEGVSGTAPAEDNSVKYWLREAGIYPGQTRETAEKLYWEYIAWWRNHMGDSQKIPSVVSFGIAMSLGFKRGRSKHGIFYYVSRLGNDVRI